MHRAKWGFMFTYVLKMSLFGKSAVKVARIKGSSWDELNVSRC